MSPDASADQRMVVTEATWIIPVPRLVVVSGARGPVSLILTWPRDLSPTVDGDGQDERGAAGGRGPSPTSMPARSYRPQMPKDRARPVPTATVPAVVAVSKRQGARGPGRDPVRHRSWPGHAWNVGQGLLRRPGMPPAAPGRQAIYSWLACREAAGHPSYGSSRRALIH